MQLQSSKYFACRLSPTILPHPRLRMGSKGQNSTFSDLGNVAFQIKKTSSLYQHGSEYLEHGHVAYQIKGYHECSNMLANIFFADPLLPMTLKIEKSKFTFFRKWSCCILD